MSRSGERKPKLTRQQINARASQAYIAVYQEHRGQPEDSKALKEQRNAEARERAMLAAKTTRNVLEAGNKHQRTS